MPSYERELDLVQGYNFKKDVQKPIGFVTALTIGTTAILADQTISTPATNVGTLTAGTDAALTQGTLPVVAVLKKIKWDLGDTDPIEFEGTLSVVGKQNVMGLLYATMININVFISWVVYEYDPLASKYYVAFSSLPATSGDIAITAAAAAATTPNGLIKKDGDNLALTISPTPSSDVQSPENYDFTIQVVPKPAPVILYLAAASTRKTSKYWGRQGPAAAAAGTS